ncbi:hypothetical protein ACHQM5_003886 [Ranunculus cassubicifolius]
MVRFSCFSTHNHSHRSKRVVRPSAEAMSKASEDFSQRERMKVSTVPGLVPTILKEIHDHPSNTSLEQDGSSLDHSPTPVDILTDSSPEVNLELHRKTSLKKSQSLGSALNREGRISGGTDSEDEINPEFSSDHTDVEESYGRKDHASDFPDEKDNALESESLRGNDEADANKYWSDSGSNGPSAQPSIAKSCSLSNIDHSSPTSADGLHSHSYVINRSRSSDDLNAFNGTGKMIQNDVLEFHAADNQDRDDDMLDNTKGKSQVPINDEDESYNYHYRKDWIISGMDEVDVNEPHVDESSMTLNAMPSKDFKAKRIEEWVNMIDLGESSSLQEMSESSHSIDRVKKGALVSASSTTKVDSKSIHGMEAAKNYVTSMPATSTSAQLANLGLVVIPFLSAFVNLKTLNLSGNTIVRITSGALPRGLHVLNLAKNNISLIEGLRDLTRLRVLDLSYNRILRIGHGLASCSCLKELYLAGNKISEVEGLHRLLKLSVLDLRFNKISTAKCLGQLAANYSSLQAINLEGNPAQRNVGDEHLKKYLQSILPHLGYFNKQSIRASGSSKEVAADRSARSAIAMADRKTVRKGGSSIGKGSVASSSHGRSRVEVVSSGKVAKDRLGRLPPPSGTKGSSRPHYLELGSKLLSDLSMRRSRSESNLGSSS